MITYLLVSSKSWHDSLFEKLLQSKGVVWKRIKTLDDFNFENLKVINPRKIFIPHWSHIIPENIYTNWECIVFHMTDLPYGRGGSPLQNLIVNGHKTTKISALKVEKGIDTGEIYLKRELDLSGTAREIFMRSSLIIHKMILEIIENIIEPIPQEGEIHNFKRRKEEDGNLVNLQTLEKVYNFIRMLDCEGYPKAFLVTEFLKIEFDKASINQEYIEANVRIFKK